MEENDVDLIAPPSAQVTRVHRALALLAPAGPLAMAAWALLVPYAVADAPDVWIPKAAAGVGRLQLAMWMLLVFALTAGVGAIVTGLVARRGSPGLGTAGMALTYVGFAALGFSGAGYDAAAVASRQAGLGQAATERLLAGLDAFQAPALGGAVFVPLMFLGIVLLAVALWRGRQVPRWAAALMPASFPLVMAGGFVAMPVNALGWLLLATGFGAAGAAWVRPRPAPAV
ncbi:hypothetical protein HII36_13160 [Nonomuraea sp. NN258]|uniref:hypothetical protein n=1 Tax=Nonomuraea antri TaxID=2730852 RepID=UPI0015699006|nr:hypothetical protein [Nonomuraea antri]NRQ32781.1 hypothetical protein [Nonomuraea antri]